MTEPLTPQNREAIARDFRESAAAAGDIKLRWGLSQVRRNNGLTIDQVAERMGYPADDVILEVECSSADPTLSTLRRYALAVGALVSHQVFAEIPEPDANTERTGE